MRAATVGGVPVSVAEVDAREDRLRGSRLASSLPRRGTSEGTAAAPLADPAAGDRAGGRRRGGGARTDGRRCAERGRAAARHDARLEIGSIAALGAGRSAGPGAVRRSVTAAVDVTDAERRASYLARNPRRLRGSTAADRRAPARRGPPPRVPALAGRPMRRAGRACTGLRASRRSRASPTTPTGTDGRSRWRSTSAARRSPPGSSTPTARWSTTPSCPRPTATPKRCGRWSRRWSPRRSPRPAAGARRRHRLRRADRPARRHRQPDQHHRSGKAFRSSSGCRR